MKHGMSLRRSAPESQTAARHEPFSVSVVMPAFNSAATIQGALASIVSQVRVPDEIIVVDGGSTDDTLRIVAEFERPRPRVISEPDDGPYDAMNKGIRLAEGEIVAILNSDDRWVPETLARVEAAFRNACGSPGIVHGNVRYRLTGGGTRTIRPARGAARWAGLGLPSVHPATFVQREVYRTIGLYDLRYPMCADQDFIYRCLQQGIPDLHLNEILADMHQGGLSATVDYREEIDAMFSRFVTARRLVAKFLWAGLGRNVNYFNGWENISLPGALLRALKGFARQRVRNLFGT
ncbi:MAG: glycosyltransferase family 2 protein [Chthoniobacteraceae bacterium]